MKYSWNIDKVLNSNTSDKNKDIIVGEDSNNLSKFDVSTFDYSKINPLKYMFLYLYNTGVIKDEMPEIYEYIFNIYKIVPPTLLCRLEFKKENIDEDYLINYISSFKTFLNDDEITKTIDYIINPESKILRLDYETENTEISQYVKGRVLKDLNNDLVLGSYYIHKNLLDIPIFTHEIGHMISGLLFGKKINPFFYHLFGETEAFYMELLASYYLSSEYKLKNITDQYRLYRLFYISSDIYDILIQDVISRHPLRNEKLINRKINKYGIQIKKEDINSILFKNFNAIYGRIVSYLIALELVDITKQDKKEGIELYKKLFTDECKNFEELLNKYHINITNPKTLKKEIKVRTNFKL